jgi:hypothetical protein
MFLRKATIFNIIRQVQEALVRDVAAPITIGALFASADFI